MAEKQNEMTPVRENRPSGLSRTGTWSTSPFRTLQRMADEMDRMFDDFGMRRGWAMPWRSSSGELWAPEIDVFQKNDELTVRADLPGLNREDVSVEITDNALVIRGERKRESEEEREGYYRSERSYGSFERVVPLPEGTLTDEAKASFRDGVLEIRMPAPPASRGRKLEISDGAKKP